jgi:STAS domain
MSTFDIRLLYAGRRKRLRSLALPGAEEDVETAPHARSALHARERILPVSLEQEGALSRIRLQEGIDISCAQELKTLLLQGLTAGGEVRVLLADATGLDVTAVQLIWAARRLAEASGVVFTLSGPVPESVSSALGNAGLGPFLFPLDAS